MNCACEQFPDGSISLCAAHANFYNRLAQKDISNPTDHEFLGMFVAMEFGYKQCEMHNNIQMARENFKLIYRGE